MIAHCLYYLPEVVIQHLELELVSKMTLVGFRHLVLLKDLEVD